MTRKIAGIILGYIIFVVSALVLFKLSGKGPHADPTIIFAILTGFAFFSLIKTNGNHRTQLLAIFVFAPLAVFGGQFFLKNKQKAALKK